MMAGRRIVTYGGERNEFDPILLLKSNAFLYNILMIKE